MWVNRYMPALRRHPVLGLAASSVVVAAAVFEKLLLPHLPPFLTLYPAVLLSALLGGKWAGRGALIVSILAGGYFIQLPGGPADKIWQIFSFMGFVLVAGLIVFVIEQLDTAIARLHLERRKLNLVLNAAKAATWELYPNHSIHWDDNFFSLVGLKPGQTVPSTEQFLAMVHPDDRRKMTEARDRMDRNLEPDPADEYRLIKPDGSLVWLENRRIRGKAGEYFFIGITQDITHRKQAEERIHFLLRELGHRVKNQLAIISKIAVETRKQTDSGEEFAEVFTGRVRSLSRSHDLLVQGGGKSADLETLLRDQLDGFASPHRVSASGPALQASPAATQYLAMAFHELATNALKYGALSNDAGTVDVKWSAADERLHFVWQEGGGPPARAAHQPGFGSTVLTRLTPAALHGTAVVSFAPDGLRWELSAPLSAVQAKPAGAEAPSATSSKQA